ncbi:MAG: zinc ribbon domain-containing protein [Clostridia bacterium]|nr:zinc ribbon domain-containing protein [Clostridia bacterium]
MADQTAGSTFQIPQSDVKAALGHLRLETNALSPLVTLLRGQAAPASLSPDLSTQLNQQDLRQALAIAAGPDLIVKWRIGGGSVDLMEFTLARSQTQGQALVLVAGAEQSSILLRVFAHASDFVAWFMASYAGKNDQTVANYIPPTVELGEFVYLLHAIDAFRIASFRGMLDYQAGQRPTLSLGDFADTLQRSVKSRDIRWLLPAFLILTPGLDPAGLDLSADKTRILMEKSFLVMSQAMGSQEQRLGFAEAGQIMGVEFYRTWLVAAGMEITVAAPGGITAVERLFLAPTALANHWVQVKAPSAPAEAARVNHQAMTYDQLQFKLNQLLEQTLALPVVPLATAAPAEPAQTAAAAKPTASAAPAPSETATAKPGTRFCANCGSPLKPDARFCKACGTKVS